MTLLTYNDIKTLIEKHKGISASIFIPTHRTGVETRQNPIRLKNLLCEAEDYLIENGLSASEARKILKPGHALLNETLFWQYQKDGLAMFFSQAHFSLYSLPLAFEELIVVTGHIHVKPLLPLLTSDGRFFVLALSQNKVRLLQGSRYSISQIKLKDVQQTSDEKLVDENAEKNYFPRTEVLANSHAKNDNAINS